MLLDAVKCVRRVVISRHVRYTCSSYSVRATELSDHRGPPSPMRNASTHPALKLRKYLQTGLE
eukprot:2482107-Pyramimonas_sp.AAC.1